jgi:hypothetical protein
VDVAESRIPHALYLEQGKHHWISDESSGYAKISQVQLSQLLEGGEWRISKRVLAPELAV